MSTCQYFRCSASRRWRFISVMLVLSILIELAAVLVVVVVVSAVVGGVGVAF